MRTEPSEMGHNDPTDSLTSENQANLIGQLMAALRHSNPNVRAGAALALGRLNADRAADSLVEHLEDNVHNVRRSAARALGMLGAPVVGLLLAQIQESSDPDDHQWLAEALAHIRDPEAADVLATAVNYLEPPAQHGAADALGSIGDPRSVPALVQTAQSADPTTRLHAARALHRIGDPKAVRTFSALLADTDPRLRRVAVRGLGEFGGEEVLATLLTRLTDEDESVSSEAAVVISRFCEYGLIDILLTALNNTSAWAQQAIAHALGGCPAFGVSQQLFELMNEEGDLQTRLTAAQSLARLGDERGKTMILRTLNAPNRETRRAAAIALGGTGDVRAVEHLAEALQQLGFDPTTPHGRRTKAMLFDAMKTVGLEMVAPLVDMLGDRNPALQGLAAEALEHIGDPAFEPLVIAMSVHPRMQVRIRAARLLGRSGNPDAVEPLARVLRETLLGPFPVVFFLRLFRDPTETLRVAAARAIGELDTQDGASLLLSSARFDPSPDVNEAAEASLARTGSPAVIVRFADLDVSGFINRALTGAAGLLLVGFSAGAVSAVWGIREGAVLAGLAASAVLGLVDGLEGRRPPIRGALVGALAGVVIAWLASLSGSPEWGISLMGAGLPALLALFSWGRTAFIQRLAGLFGGIVLGFLAGAAAGFILGA